MVELYVLETEGDSVMGWKFKARSLYIFSTREQAEKYIERFEKNCYNTCHMDYAIPGTLKTKITSHLLYDE